MHGIIRKSSPVILVVLLAITVGTAFAQTSREQNGVFVGGTQILEELLGEVRELRKAVQGNRLDTYRGLMLIERIRLQQEHVDRLSRQLDDLRLDLSNIDGHLPEMQDRVKNFESQIENEQDSTRKNQVESELKTFRSLVDQQVSQHQLMLNRESQLLVQLQSEQTKLNELNEKLDAHDRDVR
jgi:chromosome segregation ATPase